MNQRLIIVSNRSKYTVEKNDGKLLFNKSSGGLATALSSLSATYETLWVGWPGIASEELTNDDIVEIMHHLNRDNCYPVLLSRKNIEGFYQGFSNKVIWPLFHYFPQYTEFNPDHWENYVEVNRKYAEVIERILRENDILWIHDYHLMLVPGMIREKMRDATIGFFLHIPFPAYEMFRIIPWRKEILEGLLGADLIGFHTYEYGNYFLNSVLKILGLENELFYIIDGRSVKVEAFPISIDYVKWSHKKEKETVTNIVKDLKNNYRDKKIILSVDRLDYTKGIVNRLNAFELFLKEHPEYREKIIYVLIVVPSREDVEFYAEIKREVDGLVGKINGEFSIKNWSPILFYYHPFDEDTLAGYYLAADVALVTPLRDGMNLVAKEFVAVKQDEPGVLILSEMAGAAKEMNEAILINPYNVKSISDAILEALNMDVGEMVRRNRRMQKRLRNYDVNRWAEEFVNHLLMVKKEQAERRGKKLTDKVVKKIIEDFATSERKLFILDYDGTLIPIQKSPELAVPDDEILEILKSLSSIRGTEVIVISGREKKFLEKWFGNLNISLVAEHGVWIKKKGGKWETFGPLDISWKDEIRKMLEKFTIATPGTFIEEKDFSLAWHYRMADPEQSRMKVAELKYALKPYTANQSITVLEGHKVIEIKSAGVNKGTALGRWLEEKWDFVLAAGDDRTDEDVFKSLPEYAYTIKVGIKPSHARFFVEKPDCIRDLLKEILKVR